MITRLQQPQYSPDQTPFRFAIAATFTAEPLRTPIAFWGRQLHANIEIRFAPYNQVLQTLIDPAGEFALNVHGVNVILIRIEDLGQFRANDPDSAARLEANVEHLVEELRASPARLRVPLLLCICPSTGTTPLLKRLEASLEAGVQGASGLQTLNYEDIQKLYPVEIRDDAEGDRLGRIPYTEAFYCAVATMLVRLTHALVRPPFKVVALDCDNTLWHGICGEDGPEGVVLEEPHRDLHEFMLRQRAAGMLLTLASKNNEEDVLETFRVHPEMPLQPEHFVTWRLNWQSKGGNLASIARQLSLSLDSFLFIDDNPKECAEVEQAVPDVSAIALPVERGRTPHFLRHVWAFDHPVITAEDRNRSAYYAHIAEFGNEVRRASTLAEFMASLKLRVTVAPLKQSKIPRVAQLTQRTNQFNLTTIRRTEAEVANLAAQGYDCFTAEVSDRFGDYGLVGVLIAKAEGSVYRIDTMLLSCRVLGRGVEHRLLALAGETASSHGLSTVEVPHVQTAKNQPARQFLLGIGFGERRDLEDGFVLSLPAAQLAELVWQPGASDVEEPATPVNAEAQRRKVDYTCIATELSTVPDILAAVRRSKHLAAPDESMTETEQQLAAIWADLLERQNVAANDNFFDLGGHSLLAVLLLLRIRETFSVELSIDDVYSGTLTLADLAARIEGAQLGGIDPEEYAALLAEIENMSDDEARQLLARENEGSQG